MPRSTAPDRSHQSAGRHPQRQANGEEVFKKRTSLLFKTLQVVRFYDPQRNVLVYLTYSDRIIEGSPKNSITAVPILPWPGSRGGRRAQVTPPHTPSRRHEHRAPNADLDQHPSPPRDPARGRPGQ